MSFRPGDRITCLDTTGYFYIKKGDKATIVKKPHPSPNYLLAITDNRHEFGLSTTDVRWSCDDWKSRYTARINATSR